MYSYEIWDRRSPVNGALPEAVLTDLGNTGEEIYLIKDSEGHTTMIQTETYRPYKDIPLEECAQRQIDELNAQKQEV